MHTKKSWCLLQSHLWETHFVYLLSMSEQACWELTRSVFVTALLIDLISLARSSSESVWRLMCSVHLWDLIRSLPQWYESLMCLFCLRNFAIGPSEWWWPFMCLSNLPEREEERVISKSCHHTLMLVSIDKFYQPLIVTMRSPPRSPTISAWENT